MSFILDDLGRVSDDELTGRSLATFGEVVLRALRDLPSSQDPIGTLLGLHSLLEKLGSSRTGLEQFVSVLEYLSRVAHVELRDVQQVVQIIRPIEEETVMTTLAQRIEEAAFKKGQEKGQKLGQAKAILRQLQLKFGELPEPVVAQVKSGTEADFERWSELLLSAESLDGVFAT